MSNAGRKPVKRLKHWGHTCLRFPFQLIVYWQWIWMAYDDSSSQQHVTKSWFTPSRVFLGWAERKRESGHCNIRHIFSSYPFFPPLYVSRPFAAPYIYCSHMALNTTKNSYEQIGGGNNKKDTKLGGGNHHKHFGLFLPFHGTQRWDALNGTRPVRLCEQREEDLW